MAGNVQEITQDNFDQEVANQSLLTLVDFWAPWCGPCRMVTPVVEELAGEYEGQVAVGKINVDDNQDIASKYGITSIPTLMLFKGGDVVERIVGAVPKTTLKDAIDKHL